MIVFDKVTKVFPGDFVALENINLTIDTGSFVSLVGPSGAGKSTLLKMIYAEEEPTEGEVIFFNRPISSIKRRLLPYFRRNIGMVFQDFKLLPQKTVFENVSYALEVYGKSDEEINEEVPKILDIVGLLDKMEKYPAQLSGGEQQKTSLARALIHRPKVIIADEPTGNLDPKTAGEVFNLLIEQSKSSGIGALIATNNMDLAQKMDRILVMDQGMLKEV